MTGAGRLRNWVHVRLSGWPPVGDDFDRRGPFVVTTQSDNTTTFYSPAKSGPNRCTKHPVILWGNAGGTSVTWYDGLLRHLASHGFIVAAANTPRPRTGAEMLEGLATLRRWHQERGGRLYGRVDLDKVGSTGHSQGGQGAVNATRHPTVKTTAPIQPWPGNHDGPPHTATAMYFAAQRDNIVPPQTVRDRYAGATAAAGYAELAGGSHLTGMGDGGGFRGALTAWFRWQLMNDLIARGQFVAPAPALATSPQWCAYETNPRLQALGTRAQRRRTARP